MLRAARIFGLITVLTLVSSLTGQPKGSDRLDSKSVISYLNQSISWHQHFSVEEQLATEPGDVLFVNQNRQLADEIIRLSFDFAKAEAQR